MFRFKMSVYHFDFEVGRYISLEKLIEESKERYNKILRQSSQGRHGNQEEENVITIDGLIRSAK